MFDNTNTMCPACGDQCETAEHFLLHCHKYAHEHWPLLAKSNRTVPSMTDIISNQKNIHSLINYIEAMKRFGEKEKHHQDARTIAQEQEQIQN